MPGQYKEKSCKYCQKLYRKRGIYCSQSCANADREPTETMRKTMQKVATEYNRTPEAAAKRSQLNTSLASMTVEDFAVGIPDLPPDLSEYDLDGYDRADNW